MSEDKSRNMIWIDMEVCYWFEATVVVRMPVLIVMLGLNHDTDKILEIATIITDGNLKIIAEAPTYVIHWPDEVLNNMGEWCTDQHTKSGLVEACKNSELNLDEAEELLLQFLQKHTPKGVCPIAGSSIHCDKRFIDKHMPKISEHLHYRIIDVSTIKELVTRWYTAGTFVQLPNGNHRAHGDIINSINILKTYRQRFFRTTPSLSDTEE